MATVQPAFSAGPSREHWRLSARARQAKPSVILGINARAKALVAQGRDVVLFGAGEPDFETPVHIRTATTMALEHGATRYTATNGIIELREAISAGLGAHGLSTPAGDIIVTAGAKMALFEVFQAICDPGDEVVLFSPYWSSYAEIIQLAGATPVFVPTLERDGFQPDPELLRRALTPRTRALLLNSPGNPTGAVYPPETLRQLARAVEDTDLLVISDDIYEKILFDGRVFSNTAQLGPEWHARTVIINGVSKTYAMTGFRIGWASGPREVIAAMGRLQDQSTSCPTAFAQAGALAALTGPQDSVPHMSAEFERRRNTMVSTLRAMPGVTCAEPGGAFYAFPSVAGLLGKRMGTEVITTPSVLANLLLDRFGVALVPGELFGAPEHLRLSYATSMDQITRGLARMKEAFSSLTA